MDVRESIRLAWTNLGNHKLRSTLTTIGIVVGIAGVILFITLGASLQAEIVSTFVGDNENVIQVSAQKGDNEYSALLGSSRSVYTEHDIEQVESISGVERVVPYSGMGVTRVTTADSSMATPRMAITEPSYFDLRGDSFVDGRPFRLGQREVVLSQSAVVAFGGNVSVGDQITLGQSNDEIRNATVVGIIDSSDQLSLDSNAPPAVVYAPANPYHTRRVTAPSAETQQFVYERLFIQVTTFNNINQVEDEVKTYIKQSSDARQLSESETELKIQTREDLVDQVSHVTRTFILYITAVALLSLIIGAIGIANIMLVSVTERTREIGVMRAIGASRRAVLQIFLVESISLGILGSMLGTAVGVLSARVTTELINLPFTFQLEWVFAAIGVGISIGVLAGLYPAYSAAHVDPVKALNRE
ncbi:putative ABC transport system permease protein [Halogranum amylolyticum]|uniref:Putative ABC transport system permease protein n=1 Tax=Halogranum amylolyticum TaxID=660520 RepID=A0A1H8WRI5_9EURY|nr:ABC transporter permease [Halogranum amylolyticum]SEP30290.1 putative ABC transport system permease protein [Halogranum amylolyticum]